MKNNYEILWVDDEIHHLKPHILFLNKKGYNITTATNGNDAEVLNDNNRYDLVLLDQTMPGIDGIETLDRIKNRRKSLPVIMITKSEDEWLMDEAISGRVVQFLIKPISPSQIFIACKQVLEKNDIIENKAISDYLKDFQLIENELGSLSTLDDWWMLYLRLINWQINFDDYKDFELRHILIDQILTCNKRFSDFIEDNYLDIIKNKNNTLSTDVVKENVIPRLKINEKVCLIVIDCMRADQFISVIPYLESLFNVKISYHLSLLPSATAYSRNAIFSGLFPDELIDNYPEQKVLFLDGENSLNKFEAQYLKDQLDRNNIKNKNLSYHKIWSIDQGKKIKAKINDYLKLDVLAMVVNFVDMLAHDSSKTEVLKEMIPDEFGYRIAVKSWIENSWFADVLRILSNSSFKIIITSDHGSIRVGKDILVSADRDASSGVRYKYGRNLNSKSKNVISIKNPSKYRLPILGPQSSYLIAKSDGYFVYPNDVHIYKNKLQNSFQHGGISMEEMLVPIITMNGSL